MSRFEVFGRNERSNYSYRALMRSACHLVFYNRPDYSFQIFKRFLLFSGPL